MVSILSILCFQNGVNLCAATIRSLLALVYADDTRLDEPLVAAIRRPTDRATALSTFASVDAGASQSTVGVIGRSTTSNGRQGWVSILVATSNAPSWGGPKTGAALGPSDALCAIASASVANTHF